MPRSSTHRSRPVPDFRSRHLSDPSRRGHLLSLSDVQGSTSQGISSMVQRLGNRLVSEVRNTFQRSLDGMARNNTKRLIRSCWNSLCYKGDEPPSDVDTPHHPIPRQEGFPPTVSHDEAPQRRRRRSRREDQAQQRMSPFPGPAYGYPPVDTPWSPPPTVNTGLVPLSSTLHHPPPPPPDIQVDSNGMATVTPSSVDPSYPPVAVEDDEDFIVSPATTLASVYITPEGTLGNSHTPNPSFAFGSTEFQPPG